MDGLRIRELRKEQGMTLAQLASQSGLSEGMISQVERGLTDPSLETLRKISRVLNLPLFQLFNQDDAAPSRLAVLRKGRQVQITSPATNITYLRQSAGYGQLEVLRGTLAPGGASSAEPWSHPAEECVVVISGLLEIEIQGERISLEPGDSCHFDSTLPHRLVNTSDEPTVFITAVTPPSY
ncbi:cupin domain-containing protein [Arthrobacter sp. UYCu723]